MNDNTELRDAIAEGLRDWQRAGGGPNSPAMGHTRTTMWIDRADEWANIVVAILEGRDDVAVGTHADWLEKMGARSYARSRLVRLTDPEAPDDQTYGVTVRRGESVWVVPEATA